ncbi:MAG: hypothetical protein U5N23_25765 [Acidovorax sp.]|nr:hypothetical protein [Acidovorax sp.]
MNTPNPTPTPTPSGLDAEKMRSDLENLLRKAAPPQGKAATDKPAGK